MKKKIENLNSTESLEQLASYILKAANQSEMLDDTTTVTDATWSSKKISDSLKDAKDQADLDYVAIDQGVSQSGRYLAVDANGKVVSAPMQVETVDIDWATEWQN